MPELAKNSIHYHYNKAMMSLETVSALIEDDLRAVDALIRKRLHSDVVLINQLGHYIINSGGKRLRPKLVLLSARAFD